MSCSRMFVEGNTTSTPVACVGREQEQNQADGDAVMDGERDRTVDLCAAARARMLQRY